MLVVGVLGREQALDAEEPVAEQVGLQRRSPAAAAAVQRPRECDELLEALVTEAEALDGDGRRGSRRGVRVVGERVYEPSSSRGVT
jgi:hypothetical protein